MKLNKILAYTDGACSGNPGPGGIGIVICDEEYQIIEKISDGIENATNNKMELLAFIRALEYAIKNKIPNIDIYSDSSYVVNAIVHKWIQNWILNGWKTSKGEEVKNKEMWIHLIEIAPKINFKVYKVKGHENDVLNNLADKLAVEAREGVQAK